MSSSQPPLMIHASPPVGPLPASDIESIYLASLAQLQCPGRWGMTTGSWSSNGGALPYVTHLKHQVPLTHLHSLPSLPHPDEDLSREDRAEALSWVAVIDGRVSDLINHSLYSLPPNYSATIAKAHSSNLSFPQSVYIPQRIRGLYKARLQHVGLWGLGGMNDADLAEEDRKRLEEVYVQAPGGTVAPRAWSGWNSGREYEQRRKKRGEEELARKAKEVFEILERRLGTKPYFFGNRPTSPDLRLFANLSLVLETDLPNPLLPNVLKESFPALASHHERLKWLLFGPDAWSMISVMPSTTTSTWSDLFALPSLPFFFSTRAASEPEIKDESAKQISKKELAFKRGRWLWYGGAVVAMVTYLFATGLVSIDFGSDEEEEFEEVWTAVGPDGAVEEVLVVEEDDE